jgi:hypothetical protein
MIVSVGDVTKRKGGLQFRRTERALVKVFLWFRGLAEHRDEEENFLQMFKGVIAFLICRENACG